MTGVYAGESVELLAGLAAPSRSPEIPEAADLYGWFVGSWELDVRYYLADVSAHGLKGEVHAGWVLGGRAFQDVWIFDPSLNSHGTTLRVWDSAIQAWRVTWTNPVTGRRDELIGRWSGSDIVQVGTHPDGTPIRWIFSEITPDSFLWTGDALEANGRTWRLEAQFRARRTRSAP